MRVSCQDDHLTLRECVESFLCFGDEIIIVTNNATKETINLAKKLADEYDKVVYFDAKEANDLYQNRQHGLERSNYRWVLRCDADYVAYDDRDGAKRIYEYNPNVKLIMSLRNPIKRAYSSYMGEVLSGEIDKEEDIFEATKKMKYNYKTNYIEQGLYAQQLSEYLKYFKRDQMLILLFDELKSNPKAFISQIY